MKTIAAFFLQAVVVIIALAAMAFLMIEPQFEGRNAHATLLQVYFGDPFLAYVYLASVPFFVALYQAFYVLGLVRRGDVPSQAAFKSLQAMKRCAIVFLCFVAGAMGLILLNTGEDRAGGIFIGLLITLGATALAVIAAVFERRVRNSMGREA